MMNNQNLRRPLAVKHIPVEKYILHRADHGDHAKNAEMEKRGRFRKKQWMGRRRRGCGRKQRNEQTNQTTKIKTTTKTRIEFNKKTIFFLNANLVKKIAATLDCKSDWSCPN